MPSKLAFRLIQAYMFRDFDTTLCYKHTFQVGENNPSTENHRHVVEQMEESYVAVLLLQHKEHLQQEPRDENHGYEVEHMEERWVAILLPQH